MPFTGYGIRLQGGKFDLSDRLFHTMKETWDISKILDCKELIPEFYFFPEFLLNLNVLNLGKRQINGEVDEVILPLWAKGNPRFFVNMNRKALESKYVSLNLNNWVINLSSFF